MPEYKGKTRFFSSTLDSVWFILKMYSMRKTEKYLFAKGKYMKGHKFSENLLLGYVCAYSNKKAKATRNLELSHKEPSSQCRSSTGTISELSEQWLVRQKIRVKESTYNKYNNILHGYVLPYIGDICIQDLSVACITELSDTLLLCGGKRGTGLSEKTIADTISVIRSIVRYSANMGYCCPADLNAIRIRQKIRELRTLSPMDQQTLYCYLCKNPSVHNIGILICLLTGLRIGEVCALRWEDISFSDHTIYVHQTVQRIQDDTAKDGKTKVVITSPKSVSGKRVIPIPKNLETVLSNMDSRKTGFVLSTDGTHLMEPRVLQYHFKKILKELEIEEVNFHILRHTFATRCIELGFDVKSLSEILGHANVSITMNKYVHPPMALKHENMQRISSFFAAE